METIIFTLLLCGLIIANLVVSYKHHQKIDELDGKQEKARTDINELYTKPIVKQTTPKKPVAKKTKRKSNKNTKQILKG
tara:strand:- start:462 stop:698 length:237 start_codon:yes stop_codon:yes gene_type:complete